MLSLADSNKVQTVNLFISVINQLDVQNFCFTISLFHASTWIEHMCSSSGDLNCLHSLWYHRTYRCDKTRGSVMQFWPPDDEQICSNHVQAWNKLIVKQKFCASSWLITEINILRCTVSKTSKFVNLFSSVVDIGEIGCVNALWMELTLDCVQWQTLVLQSLKII